MESRSGIGGAFPARKTVAGRIADAWRLVASRALLLGMVLLGVSSGADAANEVWVAHASGTIQVAADGTVESFQMEDSVGTEIVRVLEHRIRDWRFEPVIENGSAVPVKATVEMTLRAVPAGKGGMNVNLVAAQFFEQAASSDGGNGAAKSRLPPPHYPRKAAAAGVMADLQVVVSVTQDGDATGAEIESLDLRTMSYVRPAEAGKYAQQFEAAIRSALPEWKVRTDDLTFVDGVARVRIPVMFSLIGTSWGRLQVVVRQADKKTAVAITDFGAGGAQVSDRIALLTALDPKMEI
jgi:hypothetical protein